MLPPLLCRRALPVLSLLPSPDPHAQGEKAGSPVSQDRKGEKNDEVTSLMESHCKILETWGFPDFNAATSSEN